MMEFAKSLFKFGAIGVVCAMMLSGEQSAVTGAMFIDPSGLPDLVLSLVLQAGFGGVRGDRHHGRRRHRVVALPLALRAAHDAARNSRTSSRTAKAIRWSNRSGGRWRATAPAAA